MAKQTKIFVIIALMLGTSLASLDATIVSTVMPAIVGKLGGITLYSWVFSVYLLTSTTTVPIYGKLADLYGRKPLFLFGSSLFLLGSVLAGLSQNMVQLIIFRAIQGLGAGAVLPLVMTMVGKIAIAERRSRGEECEATFWINQVVARLIVIIRFVTFLFLALVDEQIAIVEPFHDLF
jgi:MFS family permease